MDLNDDVVNEIFKNLTIKDVTNVSLVCTKFNNLLKAETLWKYYYEKTYLEVIFPDLLYRSQYRKCHEILYVLNVLGLNVSVNDIVKLSEIQRSANNIICIPPEIGQLGNLQRLNLDNNKITCIPPEIGQLGNLQWLGLRNNQITSIPPEIGHLQNIIKI